MTKGTVKKEAVITLLEQLEYLSKGIIEGIRCYGSETGAEYAVHQSQSIIEQIALFRSSITEEVQEVPTDNKRYLQIADTIQEGQAMTPNQVTALVQSRLYLYIKKELRAKSNNPDFMLPVNSLDLFHIIDNIACQWPSYKQHEKGFFHSMLAVVDEICNEIKEQRINNPQTKLFNEPQN